MFSLTPQITPEIPPKCTTRAGLFNINSRNRLDEDNCAIASRYLQSERVGRFNMSTHYLDCDMSRVKAAAMENPTILFRDGYGIGGSVVEGDSNLRPFLTRTRCSLRGEMEHQARPIRTVPYMGRGSGDSSTESNLIHSTISREQRSCNPVTEKSFINQFTPQIPHLRKNIQNPKHIIQEDAAIGWVRGGVPSRQYIRDINC